jgi:hypothetical protein
MGREPVNETIFLVQNLLHSVSIPLFGGVDGNSIKKKEYKTGFCAITYI